MSEEWEKHTCLHHSGLVKWIESVCIKMDEREKIVNLQLASMDKALGIATREMERRLEGMNEFREQLSKQAVTFITVKESALVHRNLEEKMDITIREMSKRLEEVQGCLSVGKGSDRWKDHIITVLITLAVMFTVQYIFKF